MSFRRAVLQKYAVFLPAGSKKGEAFVYTGAWTGDEENLPGIFGKCIVPKPDRSGRTKNDEPAAKEHVTVLSDLSGSLDLQEHAK